MLLDYTSSANVLPFTQQVFHHFSPELQWSPNFQIAIILAGGLSIHYKNHTREFNEHDIFFFPPFDTYSIVSSKPETQLLTLSIDANYINRLCPDIASIQMQQSHISRDIGSPVYRQICKNFAIIIFNNLRNETCSKLKLIKAITDILIQIFEVFGIKTEKNNIHEYATDRVINILQYINDNYTDKITINDIANHLGIHPQYFSAFFNKTFHTSFVDYLSTFRINNSLERLIYTNDSILDISLDYGFSNHKTYSAAFKKIYSCTPTEYRKRMQQPAPETTALLQDDADADYGLFSYFRQFLDSDVSDSSQNYSLKRQQSISLSSFQADNTISTFSHDKFLSVGRAYACLRSEVQKQIIQASKDFSFDHVRIRDIFSDDLYIYYENSDHESIYSWQSLDSVFDFIISLGAKPYPEIGFMPEQLASKRQHAGWQYHPNISAPKSLSKWKELIHHFLVHYIDRYGIDEVRSWYFDFWTCPDLNIKMAYWNETQADFFNFYKATYEVFEKVDSELKLGTPNFSSLSGFPWYEAFFQYCYANRIYPAFVSIHLYGCDLKEGHTIEKKEAFNNVDSGHFSVSNQNLITELLATLHQIKNRNGFRALDVIVSDWNLSFIPKDLIRDTCYMGPYISHTLFKTINQVKGMCFWSLSDIHEDFFPEHSLFRGGPGLIDYHGLKKASYNTYVLLDKLGNKILKKGPNYIFVQKASTYQLLIYNMAKFDDMFSTLDQSVIDDTHRYNIFTNTEDISANIIIKMPSGPYYIKRYEVNRHHGSAYDLWGEMGYPTSLTKDMEDYLIENSIPRLSYSLQDVDNNLILDETIPAHGILLLEFTPRI